MGKAVLKYFKAVYHVTLADRRAPGNEVQNIAPDPQEVAAGGGGLAPIQPVLEPDRILHEIDEFLASWILNQLECSKAHFKFHKISISVLGNYKFTSILN